VVIEMVHMDSQVVPAIGRTIAVEEVQLMVVTLVQSIVARVQEHTDWEPRVHATAEHCMVTDLVELAEA